MTYEERLSAGVKLYERLQDNGMTPAAAQVLSESVFDLRRNEAFTRGPERTGVFGLWSPVIGAWLTKNDVLLHGPDCVMQAELRRIPDHLQGALAIREFDVFGQPILESVEEMASSEA